MRKTKLLVPILALSVLFLIGSVVSADVQHENWVDSDIATVEVTNIAQSGVGSASFINEIHGEDLEVDISQTAVGTDSTYFDNFVRANELDATVRQYIEENSSTSNRIIADRFGTLDFRQEIDTYYGNFVNRFALDNGSSWNDPFDFDNEAWEALIEYHYDDDLGEWVAAHQQIGFNQSVEWSKTGSNPGPVLDTSWQRFTWDDSADFIRQRLELDYDSGTTNTELTQFGVLNSSAVQPELGGRAFLSQSGNIDLEGNYYDYGLDIQVGTFSPDTSSVVSIELPEVPEESTSVAADFESSVMNFEN